MDEEDRDSSTIGSEELDGFQVKLDAWASSLNLAEKALLQLILERAAGREVRSAEDADFSFPASQGFAAVVAPFLREIVASGALSVQPPETSSRVTRGWVEAGDPWVQGA
ncbi:hypothetical protein ACWDUL_20165 [Nocardia niigatensis]